MSGEKQDRQAHKIGLSKYEPEAYGRIIARRQWMPVEPVVGPKTDEEKAYVERVKEYLRRAPGALR